MGVRVRIAASDLASAALDGLAPPRTELRQAVRAAFRGESVREGEISLTLLADPEIAELNQQYLGHEGPTDVISFALYEAPEPVLGDVYIGVEQAARAARRRRIPLRQELVRLAAHGALHVLGHDHPDGEARTRSAMWTRQEAIVAEVEAP